MIIKFSQGVNSNPLFFFQEIDINVCFKICRVTYANADLYKLATCNDFNVIGSYNTDVVDTCNNKLTNDKLMEYCTQY